MAGQIMALAWGGRHMANLSQKHTYINKKKCTGDIIAGGILLIGTGLPYIFDNSFIYYSSEAQNLLYAARYTLTCLFGFVFLLFVVSRIIKIFEGKYKEVAD